ncbi:integrase core domain-containing protein [Streptomyces phaeochromogenes]|nr:integrase core domain-containing protein [Streptomyces phaeochromogenes]
MNSPSHTSQQFSSLATELGVSLSVGRTGQCWDNALAESFFATIKRELLDTTAWPSRAAARTAIFDFIEGWYNLHRLHSSLGYRSPAEYETALAAPPPHRWCPSKRNKLTERLSRSAVRRPGAALPARLQQLRCSRGHGTRPEQDPLPGVLGTRTVPDRRPSAAWPLCADVPARRHRSQARWSRCGCSAGGCLRLRLGLGGLRGCGGGVEDG